MKVTVQYLDAIVAAPQLQLTLHLENDVDTLTQVRHTHDSCKLSWSGECFCEFSWYERNGIFNKLIFAD